MMVTIKNGMTTDEAQQVINEALQINREKRMKKRKEALDKLGGMLSHLNKSPLEVQAEMRDGWLE